MSRIESGAGEDSEEKLRVTGDSRGVISSSPFVQGNIRSLVSRLELSSARENKKEGGSAVSLLKEEFAVSQVSGFILDSSRLLSQELQEKLLQAHEERRKGELAKANVLCDEVIASDPKAEEAYIIKAQTVINTKPHEAIGYLRIALEINARSDNLLDRAEINHYISGTLLKLASYEDSLAAANKAIELAPRVLDYYINKNIALGHIALMPIRSGGSEERIKYHTKFKNLYMCKAAVFSRLAEIKGFIKVEDLNELTSSMIILDGIRPNHDNIREIAKRFAGLSGQLDNIIKHEHIEDRDNEPDLTNNFLHLQMLEEGAGGGAGTRIGSTPLYEAVAVTQMLQSAKQLSHIGEYEKAIEICDKIIASSPAFYESYAIKGESLIKISPHEALEYFKKALSLVGIRSDNLSERASIHNFISQALLLLERNEEALIAIKEAIMLSPLDIRYYVNKNIAEHKLYLYLNPLLTKLSGGEMKIEELLRLKVLNTDRISKLQQAVASEDIARMKLSSTLGEERFARLGEELRVLSAQAIELASKITDEANAKEVAAKLKDIGEQTDKIVKDYGMLEYDKAPQFVEEMNSFLNPIIEGTAGGAGREVAHFMEVGASGGASSSDIAIAQRPEEEYFAAAKAAIDNFNMSEAEVKREIANFVTTHTKTPDEIYYELNKLRKAGKWDKLCDFMEANQEQISTDNMYANIQFGVEAKNFKVFYKMITLYPFMKEYFAAEVLNESFNGKKQSEEQIELEIKYLKEVEEKIKELGIDDNKAICANRDAGKLVWGVLEHAAYIVSDDEGRVIKHDIFEHFINKLTAINFKIDKLTAIYVMRQLRDVSHFMKYLIPLLENSSEEYYDDILDAVYEQGVYANNYKSIIGESSVGADE